jgi:hypothetical protein
MAIPIEYPNGFQESDFIDYTVPTQGDIGVETDSDFVVYLKVTPNTTSLIAENFRLELSDTGERFQFNEINYTTDWYPLQKMLVLHLDHALDISEYYTFVIENLYDAAGNEMISPYVMTFESSAIQKVIPEPEDIVNTLIAEDNSLVQNNIVEYVVPVSVDAVALVSSNPTNLSYNISSDLINDHIDFNFNFDLIDDGIADETTYIEFITIERKLISIVETSWTTYTGDWQVYFGSISPWTATFSIANIVDSVAEDLAFEDGYEYRITISKDLPFLNEDISGGELVYLDNDIVIYFLSELTNMYTSVNSVLLYYPAYEAYDVAKQIYLNSQYVLLLNSSVTADNPNAVNYVRYSTLYNTGMLLNGEANKIVLGDLEVSTPASVEETLLGRWLSLMQQAEDALRRKGPAWAVRGENYHSSDYVAGPNYTRPTRNWD